MNSHFSHLLLLLLFCSSRPKRDLQINNKMAILSEVLLKLSQSHETQKLRLMAAEITGTVTVAYANLWVSFSLLLYLFIF